MEISLRIKKYENPSSPTLKGFCTFTIGGIVKIDAKVMDGPNGLWLSYPSKKPKDPNEKRWPETAGPVSKDARFKLESLLKQEWGTDDAPGDYSGLSEQFNQATQPPPPYDESENLPF